MQLKKILYGNSCHRQNQKTNKLGEIFVNHITDQRLISTTCKELLQIN